MNKNEFKFSIGIGVTLGALALVIFLFYLRQQQALFYMEREKQIKIELIQSVKSTCSPNYPVIQATIYRDKVVMRCEIE